MLSFEVLYPLLSQVVSKVTVMSSPEEHVIVLKSSLVHSVGRSDTVFPTLYLH